MIFFQKGPVAGKIWRKTQHLRMGLCHPGNKNLTHHPTIMVSIPVSVEPSPPATFW